MLAGSAPAARAGNASWAHQAGSLSSNGSVTVKSLTGGATAATQNPTGAIAKGSQNAATQPPTVIIQATSSNNVEVIPKLSLNTLTIPTCPTGYSALWSATSAVHGMEPAIFNAGGTRFSLAPFSVTSSGYQVYGWLVDGMPTNGPANVGNGTAYTGQSYWGSYGYPSAWAAALCSK